MDNYNLRTNDDKILDLEIGPREEGLMSSILDFRAWMGNIVYCRNINCSVYLII